MPGVIKLPSNPKLCQSPWGEQRVITLLGKTENTLIAHYHAMSFDRALHWYFGSNGSCLVCEYVGGVGKAAFDLGEEWCGWLLTRRPTLKARFSTTSAERVRRSAQAAFQDHFSLCHLDVTSVDVPSLLLPCSVAAWGWGPRVCNSSPAGLE